MLKGNPFEVSEIGGGILIDSVDGTEGQVRVAEVGLILASG